MQYEMGAVEGYEQNAATNSHKSSDLKVGVEGRSRQVGYLHTVVVVARLRPGYQCTTLPVLLPRIFHGIFLGSIKCFLGM